MEFDESRVIDAEHAEDARPFIGKRVLFSDWYDYLKQSVEDAVDGYRSLVEVNKDSPYPFKVSGGRCWKYIYPLEDLPKPKMDTPLNRVLEKEGRSLVAAGYCCLANCSECAIRDVCCGSWRTVKQDIINKAYEILTNEVRR